MFYTETLNESFDMHIKLRLLFRLFSHIDFKRRLLVISSYFYVSKHTISFRFFLFQSLFVQKLF